MADIVLETERLVLRTFEDADAREQFERLNSLLVTEHLGGPRELHAIEASHEKSRASFARDGFGFMMMVEKATGEAVGYVGLKRVDNGHAKNPGDFETGWLVREDRWRRGYASEAMRAVIDWAFTRHRAPRLVAMTADRNVPSWKLMEKLGMERRRDLDFDDPDYPPEDNPTIVYRLEAADWRARAAADSSRAHA